MNKMTVKLQMKYLIVLGSLHFLRSYSKPNFLNLRAKGPLERESISSEDLHASVCMQLSVRLYIRGSVMEEIYSFH